MRVLIYSMLAVLVAVVALVVVAPRFGSSPAAARGMATITQIATFKTALANFKQDTGRYPEKLEELIQPPAVTNGWRGPYVEGLSGVFVDPWQHAYAYRSPGKYNPDSYDIASFGPDGVEGTKDDIHNRPPGK